MCVNLKYVFTRSKYISPYHRERLLVPCKCGKCCECQSEKFSEWYFRIYHEWLDCFQKGGYVFFTTLTYAPEHLPMISRHFGHDIVTDHSCFDRADIRRFLTSFHTALNRRITLDDCHQVRHFLAAEYGQDDRYTHRPHYHVLFFVTADIDVFDLRALIDKYWFYGITDKVRLYGEKSNYFGSYNTSDRSKRAVSNYVAKYVQKSSVFESEINKRIDAMLDKYVVDRCTDYKPVPQDDKVTYIGKYYKNDYILDDSFVQSVVKSQSYKKYRQKLYRQVAQFHLQSKQFGASALKSLDVEKVMSAGFLTMPDSVKVQRRIPLPKYYERKLFEEQVVVRGQRCWQPTTLGKRYRSLKESRVVKHLADKYRCASIQYGIHKDIDFNKFATYLVHYRGRLSGVAQIASTPTITEKQSLPNLFFNYSCPTDLAQFHEAGITLKYNGYADNYITPQHEQFIPLSQFVRKYCIDDSYLPEFAGFDNVYRDLSWRLRQTGKEKQLAFDIKQEHHNKFP